jgi:hypothetical protein
MQMVSWEQSKGWPETPFHLWSLAVLFYVPVELNSTNIYEPDTVLGDSNVEMINT